MTATREPGPTRPRPRRALNAADRFIRIPIGFVWMAVLAIVAVPVFLYMTALYWIVKGARAVFGRNRARRGARPEREERVA